MTLLGRDHPELSPDILFSKLEIKALKAFAARHRYAPPDTPATAMLMMSRFGGYIHRISGPPPGTKVIYRGHATLVEWHFEVEVGFVPGGKNALFCFLLGSTPISDKMLTTFMLPSGFSSQDYSIAINKPLPYLITLGNPSIPSLICCSS